MKIIKNQLNKTARIEIAHKLTKLIVSKTGVDYNTQFEITLKFVCNSYEVDILQAFMVWKKDITCLDRVEGYKRIEHKMNTLGYSFAFSYGYLMCFINDFNTRNLVIMDKDSLKEGLYIYYVDVWNLQFDYFGRINLFESSFNYEHIRYKDFYKKEI